VLKLVFSDLPRDFRRLWISQSISQIGDGMMLLALPWLTYDLTRSGEATAIVTGARLLPYPVLALVSGVIADRFDRRQVLLATDVARAAVTGVIGAAILVGRLQLWLLVVAALTVGLFSSVFDASYNAATPALVGPDRLNEANGRLESTSAVATIVGPPLAGLLLAAIGAGAVFFLDAASFLAGAWGTLLISSQLTAERVSSGSPFTMAIEGVKYLFKSSAVRTLTAATFALAIGLGGLSALLVPVLRGDFKFNEVELGLIYSGAAAAWLISSLLIAYVKAGSIHLRLVVSAAVAAVGAALLSLSRDVIMVALTYAVIEGATSFFLISAITYRQRLVPSSLLGRVHALARSIGLLGQPIGAGIAAALAGYLPGPTRLALITLPFAAAGALVGLTLFGLQTGAGSHAQA